MSTIWSHDAPTASRDVVGPTARSQFSWGRLLSRAIVILIGIAVGWVIAVFIALATGWIEISFC